jgi:predicted Zn-dependent protease with MMP-like domain
MWHPLSTEDPDDSLFESYVRNALSILPDNLAKETENVVVRVFDFADRATLRDMGIRNPYELLGLYHGVSLNHKSVFDSVHEPDMVYIYRQPILAYARETGERLEDVVRNVVIHEIGHHFGFSDDDMHFLEEED